MEKSRLSVAGLAIVASVFAAVVLVAVYHMSRGLLIFSSYGIIESAKEID